MASATADYLSVFLNGAACTANVTPPCCIGLLSASLNGGEVLSAPPFLLSRARRASSSLCFSSGVLPRGAAYPLRAATFNPGRFTRTSILWNAPLRGWVGG